MAVVRPQAPNEDDGGVDTCSPEHETGYYVIIGRGVAAWFNHETLRRSEWGRSRIGMLPVLHIGFPEPWQFRGDHRMGQWPRMLHFPELKEEIPGDPEPERWWESKPFSEQINEARSHLLNKAKTTAPRTGWVGLIERKSDWEEKKDGSYLEYLPEEERKHREEALEENPEPQEGNGKERWANPDTPYRLSVFHDRTLEFVYAYKIDLCTGPGVAGLLEKTKFKPESLFEEYKPRYDIPFHERKRDRRLTTGNEYVESGPPGQEVVVNGGTPVGAWCAEYAVKEQNPKKTTTVWASYTALEESPAKVPGGRNDDIIAGSVPYNKCKNNYEKRYPCRLDPYSLTKVKEKDSEKLECWFEGISSPSQIETITANQLVIAIGQATSKKDEGTPAYLIQKLDQMNMIKMREKEPVRVGQESVGVNSFIMAVSNDMDDPDVSDMGRVRVLGAAAKEGPRLKDGHKQNFDSLVGEVLPLFFPPEGYAGGAGLVVAMTNIRRANSATSARTRLNSAWRDELKDAGLSGEGADYIFMERGKSIRGHSLEKWKKKLWKDGYPDDAKRINDEDFMF